MSTAVSANGRRSLAIPREVNDYLSVDIGRTGSRELYTHSFLTFCDALRSFDGCDLICIAQGLVVLFAWHTGDLHD